MNCIAAVISFFLALAACWITGVANLMPVNITSGASSSSADLLVDLKAAYLPGANPRKQIRRPILRHHPGRPRSVLGFRSMVYALPRKHRFLRFPFPELLPA